MHKEVLEEHDLETTKPLKEHALETTNFEKTKLYHYQEERSNHMLAQKTVIFQKKKLKKKMLMMKSIVKLEILVIAQVNTEVLYITYVI